MDAQNVPTSAFKKAEKVGRNVFMTSPTNKKSEIDSWVSANVLKIILTLSTFT